MTDPGERREQFYQQFNPLPDALLEPGGRPMVFLVPVGAL